MFKEIKDFAAFILAMSIVHSRIKMTNKETVKWVSDCVNAVYGKD